MKTHHPPNTRSFRSLIAITAVIFVTGIAHATPVTTQSSPKAVPEKLIAPPVNDVTLAATDTAIAINFIQDETFAAVYTAKDHAIAPKATARAKIVAALSANNLQRFNDRTKEADHALTGASQTVAGANSLIRATAANFDAWAADPPAIMATG